MNRKIAITGTLFGLTGVIIGAFAAHSLKELITTDAMTSFQTGVRYQIIHALFLLFLANANAIPYKVKKAVFRLVVIGVFCFSGSIYGLSTNSLTIFDFTKIALVTPIGGAFLIFAWVVLLIGLIRNK